MGGVAKSVTNFAKSPTRVLSAVGTGGASEAWRKIYHPAADLQQAGDNWLSGNGQGSGNQSFPDFNISPEEIAANQKQITDLGQQQADQTNKFNAGDQVAREAARAKLSGLLTQQAQQSFARTLPQTAEDYNGGHLLNSSGYGNEVARQQGYLANDIANRMGQVGVGDINRSSDIGLGAIQAQQGLGQQALQRGFSLQDFVRHANVAKQIGAAAAPQVGNGKAGTGSLLSGIGSLAPLAGMAMGGPAGKAAGSAISSMTSPSLPPSLSLFDNTKSGFARYS
jgi:hypothetical protein